MAERLDQSVTNMAGSTHTVFNQAPPLVDYNLFTQDRLLASCVERAGAGWASAQLDAFGLRMGQAEVQEWAVEMNRQTPLLRTHDRFGNRVDEVVYTPVYHALMREAVSYGTHALSYREQRQGSHSARAALFYLSAQVEAGHGCPISMTHAAYPVLASYLPQWQRWTAQMTSADYDPVLRPFTEKTGLLCGMGMTEKQGGSDVRANTTTAVPCHEEFAGQPVYHLRGHKWFCSAPMSDLFLVLAQAPKGLSCFLVPRILPDGTRNVFMLQRLKDKLGNRSNASSEVEFERTWAVLVGEEGRGVRTIIEMVNATRLDCILGSAALMRQATVQAIHHATYRSAFGRCLVEQPLMRNVLTDLAIESAAATLLGFYLAQISEQAAADPQAAFLKRLGTAVGKYWVTKRAPVMSAEALECLGGNGYVEESVLPRLYREAPLNSLWEGAGNVNCLDVLRSLAKDQQATEHIAQWLAPVRHANSYLDAATTQILHDLQHIEDLEWSARHFVERLALVMQGALLQQHAPPELADAFCATRLGQQWGYAFGTLPSNVDAKAILQYTYLPV